MTTKYAKDQKASRIYLIGMMGAGKSTVGRVLAEKLNWSFVDTDEYIEAKGMTITNIFQEQGEEAFRKMELQAVKDTSYIHNSVIATGGGLPCHFDNMDKLMEQGLVIYLEVSAKTLSERLANNFTQRPLLAKNGVVKLQDIKALVSARKSHYERAHHIVNADIDQFLHIVEEILEIVEPG